MRKTPARLWWLVLGWTLLAIAILGLIPQVVSALHDLTFHLEGGENVLHWVLGAATLTVAYFLKDEALLSTLSIWYGVIYIAVGILGFFIGDDLAIWHVAFADNVLHLIIGTATIGFGVASRDRLDQPHPV